VPAAATDRTTVVLPSFATAWNRSVVEEISPGVAPPAFQLVSRVPVAPTTAAR
jgi:hypothetical protein